MAHPNRTHWCCKQGRDIGYESASTVVYSLQNGIGVTFQDARPPCQNTVRNLSSSHLPETEPSAEFSKISSVSLRQPKTLRQSHYKASGSRRSSLASDWLKMPLRTKAWMRRTA